MGVISNDGMKLPPITLTGMEFAANTPYHTVLKRQRPVALRIFPQEIATVVKEALANVVQEGTARRLRGSFALEDGGFMPIGGKTGTGDHRFEVYAANGTVLESKVMNRTATFAFYMGSRFFGVMTVFVPGEAAANYHFTSALAVQIVKDMEPALRPLVLGAVTPEPSWDELVRDFNAEATQEGETPLASPLPPPGTSLTPPSETPGTPESAAPSTSTGTSKTSPTKPAASKPAVPAHHPEKSAPVTPSTETTPPAAEPPPAPPPPQVDKPDPPPPPQAPKPSSEKEKHNGPWSPNSGSGFQFF